MAQTVKNVRQSLRRKFSHKDKDVNLDEADSADEETVDMVNKEYTEVENDDKYPQGKPGSLLNRMISYGNSKTEKQLAQEATEAEAAKKARANAGATQVQSTT